MNERECFQGHATCIIFYDYEDKKRHQNMALSDTNQAREYTEKAMQRLLQMVAYCETTSCRRAFIVEYFGGTPQKISRCCDVCSTGVAPMVEVTREAQMALQLLRARQERHLRDGAPKTLHSLKDALLGSKGKRFESWQKLCHFGALSQWTEPQVLKLLRLMVIKSILAEEIVTGSAGHALAYLVEGRQGEELLRNALPLHLAAPAQRNRNRRLSKDEIKAARKASAAAGRQAQGPQMQPQNSVQVHSQMNGQPWMVQQHLAQNNHFQAHQYMHSVQQWPAQQPNLQPSLGQLGPHMPVAQHQPHEQQFQHMQQPQNMQQWPAQQPNLPPSLGQLQPCTRVTQDQPHEQQPPNACRPETHKMQGLAEDQLNHYLPFFQEVRSQMPDRGGQQDQVALQPLRGSEAGVALHSQREQDQRELRPPLQQFYAQNAPFKEPPLHVQQGKENVDTLTPLGSTDPTAAASQERFA